MNQSAGGIISWFAHGLIRALGYAYRSTDLLNDSIFERDDQPVTHYFALG